MLVSQDEENIQLSRSANGTNSACLRLPRLTVASFEQMTRGRKRYVFFCSENSGGRSIRSSSSAPRSSAVLFAHTPACRPYFHRHVTLCTQLVFYFSQTSRQHDRIHSKIAFVCFSFYFDYSSRETRN